MTRSVTTDEDGRIVSDFNGELNTEGRVRIEDSEYIPRSERPRGVLAQLYVKEQTDVTEWDAEAGVIGALYYTNVDIDAPDEIQNDGTADEVVFSTRRRDATTATIQVDDYQETVQIDGERTEQVSTTVAAGETLTVRVFGDEVQDVRAEIEVVQA